MLSNLFEWVMSLLRAAIVVCLLVAATAGAVTFTYFIVMVCYRLIGVTWSYLFSTPWP